ncbi:MULTISPECIES: hypothetical protein [unclassified Pedobacter]|uniref:hypothetical protein n=1 Tax=unclassified Pedobacter TaxID=2628915 RepID=UPI001E61E79A|nr:MULTISPECIES: hypothetical protein [unclassified Pedobacter]
MIKLKTLLNSENKLIPLILILSLFTNGCKKEDDFKTEDDFKILMQDDQNINTFLNSNRLLLAEAKLNSLDIVDKGIIRKKLQTLTLTISKKTLKQKKMFCHLFQII